MLEPRLKPDHTEDHNQSAASDIAGTHSPPPPDERASPRVVLDPMDQMVNGRRLLALLWDDASRPSYRWLQYQCAKRTIPFCRSGGRTWFVPRAVLDALTRTPIRRGRPTADSKVKRAVSVG